MKPFLPMPRKIISISISFAFMLVGIISCTTYYFRSNYKEANSLMHETKQIQARPFLKAHLKNGDVCILKDQWLIDTVANKVTGYGTQYNFNRVNLFTGQISIPIDSVAIFETNQKIKNPEAGRIATLSILAGLDVALGLFCITNPKACFGSCPTFYLNENDNFHYSDAEGFSNAISPSMEYADIDALNSQRLTGNKFSITMKNEALETHCVKQVKLLAYPLNAGERVYQSPTNKFYLCNNLYKPTSAKADEGNITNLINTDDR